MSHIALEKPAPLQALPGVKENTIRLSFTMLSRIARVCQKKPEQAEITKVAPLQALHGLHTKKKTLSGFPPIVMSHIARDCLKMPGQAPK